MINSKLSKKSLKSRSLKLKNKRTKKSKKSKVSRKNVRKMKGGFLGTIIMDLIINQASAMDHFKDFDHFYSELIKNVPIQNRHQLNLNNQTIKDQIEAQYIYLKRMTPEERMKSKEEYYRAKQSAFNGQRQLLPAQAPTGRHTFQEEMNLRAMNHFMSSTRNS